MEKPVLSFVLFSTHDIITTSDQSDDVSVKVIWLSQESQGYYNTIAKSLDGLQLRGNPNKIFSAYSGEITYLSDLLGYNVYSQCDSRDVLGEEERKGLRTLTSANDINGYNEVLYWLQHHKESAAQS